MTPLRNHPNLMEGKHTNMPYTPTIQRLPTNTKVQMLVLAFALVLYRQIPLVMSANSELFNKISVTSATATISHLNKVQSKVGCGSLCLGISCSAYQIEPSADKYICTIYSIIMELTEDPHGGTQLYSRCHPPYTWITGQCLYIESQDKVKYADAKTRCVAMDGNLVKLNMPSDVASYLTKMFPPDGSNNQRFWVGASDAQHEGTWIWETDGSTASNIPWGEGQPDNAGGEDVLEAVSWDHKPYVYNDANPDSSNNFICQHKEI